MAARIGSSPLPTKQVSDALANVGETPAQPLLSLKRLRGITVRRMLLHLTPSRHCHGDPGLQGFQWPGSPTRMNKVSYDGYRFPPEIIQQAIWLYLRFTLSLRGVEDLLAERGVAASYETVRRWVNHFGPMIAADLRKRRLKPPTTWHLDEVYLKIDGRMVYLWRAVDAEGEVLDAGPVRAKRARRTEANAQAPKEVCLRS